MSDIAIRVKNITKTYRLFKSHTDRIKETFNPFNKKYHQPFNALTDISFEVKRGDALGIIGQNGSGKSTLLQVICGILQPTSGSVEVNGSISALLELGAGFNPEFTGRENVYLNATILGLSEKKINERIDDILAFADIGRFIDQKVKTYSSGMKIRLAFSVMTHVDADILLIDEALAVGDVFFVQKCMRWIRNFQEHGVLILVTHDMSKLSSFCQRAIWLHEGRIREYGSAKQISESYLRAYLENCHGASSGVETNEASKNYDKADIPLPRQHRKFHDQRVQFLNNTQYRNDIEIFQFDYNKNSFGKGGAKIINVELRDAENNMPLSYIVGGELVKLFIKCRAVSSLLAPIVGFYCTNSQGQELFGDNTFLTYRDAGLSFETGEEFYALFEFQMPLIPGGDYSLSASIAEGTQNEHVIHDWYHDALILRSQRVGFSLSLISIPMINVEINQS